MSAETTRVVVGTVLAVLVLAGPVTGVDFTAEPRTLGDGTATVDIQQPTDGRLRITAGRFGTNVSYLRVPDLVVDVRSVEGGSPRLVYEVSVPELGVERRTFALVDGPGQMRIRMADPELRGPVTGPYRGRLTVRVQSRRSFRTVLNRSVEVVVR